MCGECNWYHLKTAHSPMVRERLYAESSTIKLPSFYKQMVNAKSKSNHFVAFALNQQSTNKQIHRVCNFRKISKNDKK